MMNPTQPPTPSQSPPGAPAQPPQQPPSQPPPSTPQPTPSKKVLIAEDEESIRELYVRQLTRAGFIVKTAVDGTAGLAALKTETFDVVLLDIMMPGLNGLQVLKEFKQLFPQSPTKIILLTNLGQEAVIKEGFDLGAQAYLIKASYTPEQVVNEVRNVLAGQPTIPPPA